LALIGAVVLTGCKKHVNPTPDPTPTPITENALKIGDVTYPVTDVLGFAMDEESVMFFEMGDYYMYFNIGAPTNVIPVGTFVIDTATYDNEAFLLRSKDNIVLYGILGNVKIEKDGDDYIVSSTGSLFDALDGFKNDSNYTLYYKGKLGANGNGNMKVGDENIALSYGMRMNLEGEIQGQNICESVIALANVEKDAAFQIELSGEDTQTGTFQLSQEPVEGKAFACINMNDLSYVCNEGNVVIAKDADKYTITSSGTGILVEGEGENVQYTTTYEGKIFEISLHVDEQSIAYIMMILEELF